MTKARDLGDNAQNTKPKVVNAKADLIVGTGSDAADRLAVGNNGETLVADSSATTGLRWQGNFAAGKNKIINGDFRINQRAFSSTTTSEVFGFDRFFGVFTDGTSTYSSQTFTPGTAPVAGYEGSTYARLVSTGQTATNARTLLRHNIESVKTLAGTDITVSFWAQAGSGTPKIAVEVQQNYGSGGSPSSAVNYYLGQATLSTSWQRFSFTYSLPSLSGKTLGTTNDGFVQVSLYVSAGSDWNSRTGSLGIQSNTFNIWGLQVEQGSVATAFQTATGTLAGELAACQRYYYRISANTAQKFGVGLVSSATSARAGLQFPVTMRTAPTALEQSGTATDYSVASATAAVACSSVPVFVTASSFFADFDLTVASGLTAGQAILARSAATNAYLGWSAEL